MTMRRIKKIFQTTGAISLSAAVVIFGLVPGVRAEAANAPSLVISQLKITSSNGQFVTLYNATNSALDLSKYQLEYFNSFDLTKATSSRLIALDGILPPHSYFMANDSGLLLCYKVTVDSMSLGFSSTAGIVEVLANSQSAPGTPTQSSLQDYIAWSKSPATGAQTLPTNTSAFLMRQPTDVQHNPQISTAGTGSWQPVQPDPNNACNLVNSSNPSQSVSTGMSQLLPNEPPSVILGSGGISSGVQFNFPSSDAGLVPPQITELLPNPIGTGNDSTDEFIELYNGNAQAFDLSGFSLSAGLSTQHTYTFPDGTILPPLRFTAFYSRQTTLSLSNTTSQVKLLDPQKNIIDASDVYVNAKDGQSWALAQGRWYWSAVNTPGAANIIQLPLTTPKGTQNKLAKSVRGATVKQVKSKAKKKKIKASHVSATADKVPESHIHTTTLAAIGGLAILYGAYEYRTDLANRLYELRRNRSLGRENRPAIKGRRSD